MGIDLNNIINFKTIDIHPDTEIDSSDINNIFLNIQENLDIINTEIKTASINYKTLLEDTKSKLNSIKASLRTEKERLEDINILCSRYNDFTNIISINEKNSTHNLSYNKNAFCLKETSSKTINYEIADITGNGYEGNANVYSDNVFVHKTNSTDKREYIKDKNIITFYEYSRITADNSEKRFSNLVNFDSIYAKCSIILKSSEDFNSLELTTETEDLILESASISQNGYDFEKTTISNIQLNNRKNRYKKDSYIYGSGIISFSNCKYIKLILKANSNTSDKIAFLEKNSTNQEQIIELKTAKRSVIKINDITLKKSSYSYEGKITFKNFISSPATSIAIYSNEYGNEDINIRDNIKYTFAINGTDYNIVPINSNFNGKKIIRTTSGTQKAEHVHYLNENIKNATLYINLTTTKSYSTPYVSDIKLLLAGEEDV